MIIIIVLILAVISGIFMYNKFQQQELKQLTEEANKLLQQDFKITGYSNTAAETYAKENGFEFISLGEQILTGDANQDGTVNIKDVTYLQMHIAGNKNTDGSPLIDETNKQLFDSIDMNNDGKLTVNDVTALQTYLTQNN